MSASQGGSRGARAAARSVAWVAVAWPAALLGGRSILNTRGVYSHRLGLSVVVTVRHLRLGALRPHDKILPKKIHV